MLKLAVTGGLASGKSTVCNYLKNFGAFTISADGIVHQLLTPETAVGKKVIAYLGPDSVKLGKIDRKYISELIFSDTKKLKGLEKILHPAVLEEIEREYERVKNLKTFSFFVAEIPLLYECAWQSYFDDIVAVVASKDLSKERYQKMAKAPSDDYEKRMQRQMTVEEKQKLSKLTIINNGSLEDLESEVKTLISQIHK